MINDAKLAKSFDTAVDEIANVLLSMSSEIKKDPQAVMVILDGPSGVGKSTFSAYLYEQLKQKLEGHLSLTFLPQDLFGLSRSERVLFDIYGCADAARDLSLVEKLDDIVDRKQIKVTH